MDAKATLSQRATSWPGRHVFIKDALDDPPRSGSAGSCLNLHEADACGFEGDTLDLIAPAGSAVEIVPFALMLNDGNGPTVARRKTIQPAKQVVL